MYPDLGFKNRTIVTGVNEVRGSTFFSLYIVLCAPVNYHFARTFGATTYMMTYVALFAIKCILFVSVVHSCAQMKQKNAGSVKFYRREYISALNMCYVAELATKARTKKLKRGRNSLNRSATD